IPILIYKRTSRETRHCEEGKARRGNPQQRRFLQKLVCYPSSTLFMDCFFASLIAMTVFF
ncbi:MAG: hypothetical protein ACK5BE_03470, partial [Alphaproteobacteria bacterium]